MHSPISTSHNPSKEENTSLYDKHHIQRLTIIHISLFNHIKLFTKGLQSNRPERPFSTKSVSHYHFSQKNSIFKEKQVKTQ